MTCLRRPTTERARARERERQQRNSPIQTATRHATQSLTSTCVSERSGTEGGTEPALIVFVRSILFRSVWNAIVLRVEGFFLFFSRWYIYKV